MYRSSGFEYRKVLYKVGYIFCLVLLLAACKKNDGIGLNPEEALYADITDTVTVNTSTLLLDSLPTAGKGVMLVGRMQDAELGNIRSSSYFQISGSDVASTTLEDYAKFDSIRIKLQYSGYYYGDTSVRQEISVHQLAERIAVKSQIGFPEPEEQDVFSSSSTFYNRTAFNYSSSELGKINFAPRPASKDSLMIRLSQDLGSTLFALVKNNNSKLSNTEDFLDYFKGLVLVPGQSTGNAVIGFTDTAVVKIYYSYPDVSGNNKKGELQFNLYDNSHQFNNITADRSNTVVKDLSLSHKLIPAGSTAGKTYVQGGIGLVTKIEIPYVGYLSGADKVAINKAELLIESPAGTDVPFGQPSQLVLLVANKNNKPVKVLTDAVSGQSALYLNQRVDGWGKSSYSFPLTEYVSNYNKSYQNTSLLLSLPVEALQNSLNRLVVGSPGSSKADIKLKITYTKLNL